MPNSNNSSNKKTKQYRFVEILLYSFEIETSLLLNFLCIFIVLSLNFLVSKYLHQGFFHKYCFESPVAWNNTWSLRTSYFHLPHTLNFFWWSSHLEESLVAWTLIFTFIEVLDPYLFPYVAWNFIWSFGVRSLRSGLVTQKNCY